MIKKINKHEKLRIAEVKEDPRRNEYGESYEQISTPETSDDEFSHERNKHNYKEDNDIQALRNDEIERISKWAAQKRQSIINDKNLNKKERKQHLKKVVSHSICIPTELCHCVNPASHRDL